MNEHNNDNEKVCYNTRCSHCINGNECWYDINVCKECFGRKVKPLKKAITADSEKVTPNV